MAHGDHSARELDVLLQDYAATRHDSRNFWTLMVALLTIGVAVFGEALILVASGNADPPARIWAVFPLFPL